ncbi:SCO family protein [Geomonas sp. Red32]|uniref:SCO family protein n=1 Tax=Geomonas sp. Red32 TaxID=2912856 RepID=UPI00202CE469|nr:SCO family protein [Geomonas sp. Red32]
MVTALAVLVPLASRPVPALAHDPADLVLAQVGVDEKLGARLPLDSPLFDQRGRRVTLGSYFTGQPVIVSLNYFSCPTLCPVLIRNLASAISKAGNLAVGKDFKVVTVSLDPEETVARAAGKAQEAYGIIGKVAGLDTAWPFLFGSKETIGHLASSMGVRYTKLPGGEIAHPNVIVIVTADGIVSRYLYGIEPSPQDLRLGLVEASKGKIGGSPLINQALLYCFHYDPVGKRYVLIASRVMTAAMTLVFILTVTVLGLLWKREARKRVT